MSGGVLTYIKDTVDVKRRTGLETKMHEAGKLESVFLEIMNEKRKMKSLDSKNGREIV